jgi:putative ABC transport system permease protein
VLRLLPLGAERADSETDLAELYASRRRDRGRVYATRRLLGDVLSVATPRPNLSAAAQDMRYGLRLFRKHTAVVGITVVGLGLAIAMCTTVFSILSATILRPYDMDDPSTVVRVHRLFEQGTATSWPYSAFAGLQRSTQVALEASLAERVVLGTGPGTPAAPPEPILFVSGGYLPLLGGRPLHGRTLEPSDDRPGAAPVVVISHAFWTRHFNGDAAIIGRAIAMGRGSVTVAGVLRPPFSGPLETPPSFWAPFATHSEVYGGAAIGPSNQIHVNVIARTAAGGAPAAQEQLSAVASRLPAGSQRTTGALLESAGSRIGGPDAGALYLVIAIIFLVVGLVLALACANVANLLLAGASTRAREFGIRIAMGASRQRLLRQLLTESLVVGAAAGAFGFLLSLWLVPTLAHLIGLSPAYDVRPDLSVMLFTFVIALGAGVGAGLAPARHGARSDVAGLIKSQSLHAGTSPRATRLRRGFIGFQAAASMLLLVTAALFLRAAMQITRTDLGFDADRLVSVGATFPQAAAAASEGDDASIAAYWRTALDRVRALPSVEGASLAMYPPFGGPVVLTERTHEGSPYTIVDNWTDAAYFQTAGFRIVRGRAYTPAEVEGHAPVAVVSESLARDFLPGVEPVGASLSLITLATSRRDGAVTIIGVVADAVTWRVRAGGNGAIYRPIDPKTLVDAGVTTLADARIVIRTPHPAGAIRDVEAALVAIDSRMRPDSTIIGDDVAKYLNEPTILAGLSGAVALLALVLSVLGIFGVTSFVVSQRTQEVSVRMAIGATAGDVMRLLIGQNIWPVAVGLIAGLAVALLGSRVLGGALSGLSPYDPLAIVPAVLVLSLTALVAIAVPARRAARTDPASVLRQ